MVRKRARLGGNWPTKVKKSGDDGLGQQRVMQGNTEEGWVGGGGGGTGRELALLTSNWRADSR
jgi:hypothetical protein